jgi:hypothetical protein
MLLLESYARNYWKMQSKYLTDKPATRKLIELLVQRNDKFSRQVLVEMMQLREKETKSEPSIDDLMKQYKLVAEKLATTLDKLLVKHAKDEKFSNKTPIKPGSDLHQITGAQEILTFIPRDIESTELIKQVKEYMNLIDELKAQIESYGDHVKPKYSGGITVDIGYEQKVYNLAVSLREVRDDKNAKSALGRILMFFGVNFKSLWEKLTTKYKLPFWGSIILGLLIVALITIYQYGKENTIAKLIKNVLIAAITGFALYNLIVLIMSLKDQFSTTKIIKYI